MRAFTAPLRGSFLASGAPCTGVTARTLTSLSHTHPIGRRAGPGVPPTLSAPARAVWVGACSCARRSAATRTPYGSVPADIGGSRSEGKPREEDVLRAERLRSAGGGGASRPHPSPEAAHAESASAQATGYNPWEVLGLKAGASTQTIRLRYHELMKEVHPDMAADGVGDIPRLNQINKAYELITKSPTLDRRFRNLVSDKQYFYYRFLPEWMARNVDEMPRYWSWVKWRTPGPFQIFLLCVAFYTLGRFFAEFPKLTTVFVVSVAVDVLLHTMIAPATLSMLFLYSILAYRSYDMAWLTSPKGFLRRELGY